jgi:hypothetical protein
VSETCYRYGPKLRAENEEIAGRECHEFCVSGPAHAGFSDGLALMRSSNMRAN